MVCRLIDFALVVLKLLMFKVCGIIVISKSSFSIFSVLKELIAELINCRISGKVVRNHNINDWT